MKLNKSLSFNILLALLVASFILFLSEKGFLKRLEQESLDLSFWIRGPCAPQTPIVIIEITDSDITAIGRWPWKRSWHAAMTEALSGLGAKYIYFDIIFSEASNDEDDGLLEGAIKKAKNVYLPFVFPEKSLRIQDAFLPIKRFFSYLKGTGTINIYPDSDGTFRRIPLLFPTKQEIYPHIALKIAMDYSNMAIKEMGPRQIILSNPKREIKIPLSEKNIMLINWPGEWQNTFKHYSFLEVLAGYKDFLDQKKPKINITDFKDSLCLVAVTAIGLYDIRSVPLQPEYPGIGIVATSVSNIIDKNFLFDPPDGVNTLLLYILTLMPAFLIFGEKPLRETVFVFLMCGVYFMANFLFFKNGLMLHLATPLLGLFASYLTVETYNFVRVSMERQNFFKMSIVDGLTGLFNIRYFKMLLETEFMLAEPDPNKKFSIVMMDIDHFKHFNDTYGHQVGDLVLKEVANVLKASVRSLDIVARYGGEEMIILLRGTPLKNALIVGEKIRKNVENFQIKDQHNSYKVTISLGVSTFKPEDNVETIIKQADKGLYKAKSAGRNRVETEEGIEELAGLYDIKHFYAILSAECQAAKKERNKKLCVIFSSIDNFQNFADIHGEHTGELVLEEVANILQAAVRSSDVVAEYEKGKMIVLLRGTPLNDGLAIAEKIRNTLKSSLIKDDTQSYEITVSLAISCVKAGDAADTIIERLKSALNKEPGINRVFSV